VRVGWSKAGWSFRLRLHSGLTTPASNERSQEVPFWGSVVSVHTAKSASWMGPPAVIRMIWRSPVAGLSGVGDARLGECFIGMSRK